MTRCNQTSTQPTRAIASFRDSRTTRSFAAALGLLLLFVVPRSGVAGDSTIHRANLIGDGTATVVFEAGMGDTGDIWRKVQTAVASGCARTLAYNRAGYPGSPGNGAARDAASIVAELRDVLAARGLRPPYVLVGHSLGGLYMQYFARNFPDEVAGLLLVDSTHWDQLERIRLASPTTYAQLRVASLLMSKTMRREMQDSEDAGRQVNASPLPRDIPTIVLSSTKPALGETPAFRVLKRRLQDEIAEKYGARKHLFQIASGHYIQRDRPKDVIKAARELAGCGE